MKWGDLAGTLSVASTYYERFDRVKLEASALYPVQRLGALLTEPFNNGIFKKRDEFGSGTRLVNVVDLYQDEEVKETSLERVNASADEIDRFGTVSGDVLFNRSSLKPEGIGWSCMIGSLSEPAVFECHIIRACVRSAELLPAFLNHIARSAIGRRYLMLKSVVTTMATIDQPTLANLPVIVPPLPKQRALVAAMDDARGTRRAKLEEADHLLASMDAFVLEALGISAEPPQQAIFAVTYAHITAGRCDPDFHSLRFQTTRRSIEKGKYPSQQVGEITAYITTGFAAGRQDQAFDADGVPHLRPLNMNSHGELSLNGTKMVPASACNIEDMCVKGEVLFNNTNSTEHVGKSTVFELSRPSACSNHMTRLMPARGVDAHYLAAVFNALRSLGYLGLLSTNFNNQAGINSTTLRNLILPIPDLRTQERIAAEVRQRRETARRLRGEAEAGWQQAKAWFEAQLLGS